MLATTLIAVAAVLQAPDRGRLFRPDGTPTDPAYFPVAVWLQDPKQAARYKEAGINLYVGLWRGPTDSQLDALRAAGMPVVCSQNRVGLAHRDDPTVAAWMHGDEPDNAQPVTDPKTGRRGYGPPVKPSVIESDYRKLRATDPSRPVLLNLGQGVANDAWKGRGPGASLDDYPGYVRGADVVSFDVYPVAGLGPGGAGKLWYVAKGVERLGKWTGGRKPVWSCIECTHISDAERKATPAQVKSEVWMALVAGARGLIYFVHQFKPRFNEHALLDDPEMLRAVTAVNRQIRELAPVLNSPPVAEAVAVESSPDTPVGVTLRRHGGATYVFAVNQRNATTRVTFTVKGQRDAAAEVLGEGRKVDVRGGGFTDEFSPYEVHLYRIPAGK